MNRAAATRRKAGVRNCVNGTRPAVAVMTGVMMTAAAPRSAIVSNGIRAVSVRSRTAGMTTTGAAVISRAGINPDRTRRPVWVQAVAMR